MQSLHSRTIQLKKKIKNKNKKGVGPGGARGVSQLVVFAQRVRSMESQKPCIVVHSCNSSTWEVELGGSKAQDWEQKRWLGS